MDETAAEEALLRSPKRFAQIVAGKCTLTGFVTCYSGVVVTMKANFALSNDTSTLLINSELNKRSLISENAKQFILLMFSHKVAILVYKQSSMKALD